MRLLPDAAVPLTPESTHGVGQTAQANTSPPPSFAARLMALSYSRRRDSTNRYRLLQKRFGDPLLTVLTVMLAVLLFIVGPMQAAGVFESHHFGIAFALLLVAAVFIMSGSLLGVGALLVAIGLVVTATVMRLHHPSVLDIYLDASAWFLAAVTMGLLVARAVFGRGDVTFHRVLGAVQLYLDIGLMFVALFCFVALTVPNSFVGLQVQDNLALVESLIYFSFVTLTSVGYGDITPLHPYARGLANVEAIIGQLYPVIVLARLVTLELEGRRPRNETVDRRPRDRD